LHRGAAEVARERLSEAEMTLFDNWCNNDEQKNGKKSFWKLTEKNGSRSGIKAHLALTVRSHYDSLDRIAEDVEELGYKAAATILRERLPRGKKARSGDIGEILASELTEERLGFKVPVRRMRYKDGREVALRGDDFIGVQYHEDHKLRLLKGESKSRVILGKTTITQARDTLNRDNGRCTPHSLLFVVDRLVEGDGEMKELGRAIRKEVAEKALPASRIDHALFTLSGNAPPTGLTEDYDALASGRKQTVINFRIEDHADFIGNIYKEAGSLGDD
jgi:hypothetical protein